MKVLLGKPAAESILARVGSYAVRHSLSFAIVQVGEDPASSLYVQKKLKTAQVCGIRAVHVHLKGPVTFDQVQEVLHAYKADPSLQGIIVQLPLPSTLDPWKLLNQLPPEKDIDGLHPTNVGLLAQGRARWAPATPTGIVEMLQYYGVSLRGKKVCIIGRGPLVGTPLALLLSRPGYDATVTLCHSRSNDLLTLLKEADILVAAAGVPHLVTAEKVPQGAILIDVGIHRQGNRLVGDIHPSAYEKAQAYTPVPGGVGPLTVAALLENLCRADAYQRGTTYRPIMP
ncbi:MAG: bifunctional 5,10-methylenetetrahydrofolate dehydrogenase/5,10-methenyltetrahydrofolate cyclohydrolase [Bacteroidia bacterium]